MVVVAPPDRRCTICEHVADTSDINVRMFDEDGTFLGNADAAAYLRGIGMAGHRNSISKWLKRHRAHVERYLADPYPTAPLKVLREGVTRLPDRPEVGFLSFQNRALNVGDRALEELDGRVERGYMEDADLISVARLGLSAAAKRADMAAKGREIQAEALARLAYETAPEST